MISGDPVSQNCFGFVLLLRVRFAQEVRDRRPSPFFSPASRPTGVDDSCEIGLLSLKGRCRGKFFFVIYGHFPPEWTLFLSCSDSSRSTCIMVKLSKTPFGLSNCCRFVSDLLYSLSWTCCRHSICCGHVVDLFSNLT